MTTAMLRTFFASGSLGPIALGAQRTAVEAAFGPPDDFDARAPTPELAEIWKYGDVELHFAGERIRLIHIDRFSGSDATPAGSAGLDLDPWVVVDQLSLEAFVDTLERSGLQYTILVQPDLDRILVNFPSSAQVGFSGVSPERARLDFISQAVQIDLA
jgi:hypothetical protein